MCEDGKDGPWVFQDGENRDGSGRFKPGCAAGPGRPKGCENRSTADAKRLKAMICEHAAERGESGKARLVEVLDQLAAKNPAQYVSAVTKILPAEIQMTGFSPLVVDSAREIFGFELLELLSERGSLPTMSEFAMLIAETCTRLGLEPDPLAIDMAEIPDVPEPPTKAVDSPLEP
jgi:hypothetical protein